MCHCQQVAIAIYNQQLLERTRRNSRQLAALNELGQAVSQQIETEQVLEVTYQQLQHLVQLDAFFVALYDREADTISLPVMYDEGRRYAEPPSPFNPNSYIGQVVLSGEPRLKLLTADELTATTTVKGALGNVDKPSASLLYVPLKVGTQTIGVLSVQSYQVNAYSDDTVQLMNNAANQVAVAIQNARLFNEARTRAQREQTLREITARVRSSTDPDAIVRVAVQDLGQALHRAAFIRLGSSSRVNAAEPPTRAESANDALNGASSGNGHGSTPQGGN